MSRAAAGARPDLVGPRAGGPARAAENIILIAAALAWYAETPETLERCARSLGGVCDILVALGGRWDGFPALADDRPAEQSEALFRGAADGGLMLCEVARAGQFASQVEKRAELMAAARAASDWVFVIDADEYVVDLDSDAFVGALEKTRADVASVYGIRVPVTASSARRPWRRIYRSSTGVTVRHAHNGYVTDDGRWLYGTPAHVPLEPVLDLTSHLLIAHDIAARGEARREARMIYNRRRRDSVLEAWPVTPVGSAA